MGGRAQGNATGLAGPIQPSPYPDLRLLRQHLCGALLLPVGEKPEIGDFPSVLIFLSFSSPFGVKAVRDGQGFGWKT
jgi:hypothetical protein